VFVRLLCEAARKRDGLRNNDDYMVEGSWFTYEWYLNTGVGKMKIVKH